MLLCWCLGRCSVVRVNVSKPLSWSVLCGCGRLESGLISFSSALTNSATCCTFPSFLATFAALSGWSLASRLWLNFGVSNMRAKGLADVVKGLGAKRL